MSIFLGSKPINPTGTNWRVTVYYGNHLIYPNWWIYYNASLGLITVMDGKGWIITLADKNLGASQVYQFWDAQSETNCWKFYQWWNNYWFPFTWTTNVVQTTVDPSWYSPSTYSSSEFHTYVRGGTQYWWMNPVNPDLWGGVTNTLLARQWPCPSWFHIPSNKEWSDLVKWYLWWALNSQDAFYGVLRGWNSVSNFFRYLKLPMSWYLRWAAQYWRYDPTPWELVIATNPPTSEGDSVNAMYATSWASNYLWVVMDNPYNRYNMGIQIIAQSSTMGTEYNACGMYIRPFKDTPVYPDSTWDIITQAPWFYYRI